MKENTTKKADKKEQIWAVLFFVTPIMILSKLGKELTDDSFNRTLFAMLFGGLGGLLGIGLLQLVKTKTTLVKIISIILFTGLCFIALIVAIKNNNP